MTIPIRRASVGEAVALSAFLQEIRWPGAYGVEAWTCPALRLALADGGRSFWIALTSDDSTSDTSDTIGTSARIVDPDAILGVLLLDHDAVQGISRVSDVRLRHGESARATFEELLTQALRGANEADMADVVYVTTRAAPLRVIEWMLSLGFHVVGRFPGARTLDASGVNAIAVRVTDQAAREARRAPMHLHPATAALGSIALPALDLTVPPLDPGGRDGHATSDSLPPIEILNAPLFVRHRFETVRAKRFLAAGFYPFHEPNVIACDPVLSCEVFLNVADGFGTIIGEHLQIDAPYAALLTRVTQLLDAQGVRFIQVLCLAADVVGLDAFLEAGFLPCAYLPAFQRHGKSRMDSVVLSFTFEKEKSLPESAREEFHAVARAIEQTKEWWAL